MSKHGYSEIRGLIPNITYLVWRKTWEGWTIPTRVIYDYELVLITDGEGVIIYDGIKYEVKRGNCIYIRPNQPHSLYASSHAPMRFLAAHFDYSVIYGDGQVVACPEFFSIKPVFELKEYHKIYQAFKKLHDKYLDKSLLNGWQRNILFVQVIYEILEDVNSVNYQPVNIIRINSMIEYILKNYKNKVSLNELVNFSGLSKTYIIRIFSQHMGITPLKYINKIRIEASKDMIINSRDKIKLIANNCGFEDELYFCKAFKKQEGISPTEYRKKNINFL